VVLLEEFAATRGAGEEVPQSFLPVPGERMLGLIGLHERAVIYVWREDCNPCDQMRDSLDTVFETPPSDIGLYAVYGPDCPVLLQEEIDVAGGPTTLYVSDGEVDCRHIGGHGPRKVRLEVETLREIRASSGVTG